jgi:hypothetical protein
MTDAAPRTFLMVTGPRWIKFPQEVETALGWLLSTCRNVTAISGGCEGADTLFARAAIDLEIPLRLYLPNRYYRDNYPGSVSDEIVAAAEKVLYTTHRPDVIDWRRAWNEGNWWYDNFTRNKTMITAADEAVVVSPCTPDELLTRKKGGTVHCLKALKARGHHEVWWVPDVPDASALRWPLGKQPLF